MTPCKRLSSALLDQIVELHGGGQMYGSVEWTAEYGSGVQYGSVYESVVVWVSVVQCMSQCMGQ